MSTDTTTKTRPTYLLALAEVRAVERVSPNFVRITFGGDELDELGTLGDTLDSRIKLIFPPRPDAVPPIDRDGDDWWGSYLAVPEDERGSMRTYSVRELTVTDAGTEIVVDFVLHLRPGLTGPASRWAAGARVGQPLFIVGPRRGVSAREH
uniref:siderophore-interacting protein n=1 Tax=Microbacterium sp. TaxID=51671 RepID=UPI0028A7B3C2